MLILTRRIGEAIIIGDDIAVKPLATRGKSVRLGVQAPRHIKVSRDRTCLSVKTANQTIKHLPNDEEEL